MTRRRHLIHLAAASTLAWGGAAPAQLAPPPSDADTLAADMRLIAGNPGDVAALADAGEASIRLGDLSGAASLFARADKADPRNGRVKAGMADVLLHLERPGEALRYYSQAEGFGYPVARFARERALAYDLTGQQARAQQDYRLALAAAPDDETLRRYALSLAIAGQREAALQQLDPLLRRSDRGAWRARAFILAMGGDVAGATNIATVMMAPGQAQALGPFFARLGSLDTVGRAFAVHFGELRPTPQRLADARLAPALPPLAPEIVAVARPVTAPARIAAKPDRRKRGKQPPVQLAVVGPPPLPPPPAYGAPVGPAPPTTAQRPVALASATTRPPLAPAPAVAAPPRATSESIAAATATPKPPPKPPVVVYTPPGSMIPRLLPRPATEATASVRPAASPAAPPIQVMAATPARLPAAGSASATATAPGAATVAPRAPAPSSAAPPARLAAAAPPVGSIASAAAPSVAPATGAQRTAVASPPLAVATAPASLATPVRVADARPAIAPRAAPVAGPLSPAAAEAPPSSASPVVAAPLPAPAGATAAPGFSTQMTAVAAPPPAAAAPLRGPVSAPASPPPAAAEGIEVASLGRMPSPISPAPSTRAAPADAGANVGASPARALAPSKAGSPAASLGASSAAPAVAPPAATPPATPSPDATPPAGEASPAPAPPTPTPPSVAAAAVTPPAAAPPPPPFRRATEPDPNAPMVNGKLTEAGRRLLHLPAASPAAAGKEALPLVDTAAARRAAEKKAAADKKLAAEKKAAAEAKAQADKEAAEAKRIAKAEPKRYWVQVAGGANEAGLPRAWALVQARAPALAGRHGWTTPLRFTNRVLAGPFKTDEEARGFKNTLIKQGVAATQFTSEPGQKIARLPSE